MTMLETAVRPEDLPETLREMHSVIGMKNVLRLVKGCGGDEVTIPSAPEWKHRVVKVLGQKTARLLAARFGGETLYIPRLAALMREARDGEIRREFDAGGASALELANRQNLSKRRVKDILGGSGDSWPRTRNLPARSPPFQGIPPSPITAGTSCPIRMTPCAHAARGRD